LFSENQAKSSLSSSSSSTTASTSRLLSSTRLITVKVNKVSYNLTRQNDNQMLDPIEDKMKIVFLILSIFCISCVFLKWKKYNTRIVLEVS
jgi:hypothetical protein